MGVIHKLKKEVVDFIIGQKTQDPSLSCRQLVQSVKQKFQVKISKSSVSDVLKDAQLSSPVGRRSRRKPVKKFQFPPHKREALFPADLSHKPALDSDRSTPFQKKDASGPAKGSFSDLAVRSGGEMVPGLGCVFLKAAEWELSRHPFFIDLYREHLTDVGLEAKAEALSNTLLYLPVLGMNEDAESPGCFKRCLELFSPEAPPLAFKECSDMAKILATNSQLLSKMVIQMASDFLFVKEIDLTMEDGTRIRFDPEMRALLDSNVQSEKGYPLNHVIQTMSNLVLDNVHSVCLLHDKELQSVSNKEIGMILAFMEAQNRKLKKVSVYDLTGDEIVSFSCLIPRRRSLTIGFALKENPFLEKVCEGKMNKLPKQELCLAERTLYCQVFNIELAQIAELSSQAQLSNQERSLQVSCLLISVAKDQKAFLALFNTGEETQISKKSIVEEFLGCWPGLEAGSSFGKTKENGETKPNQSAHCLDMVNNISSFSENFSTLSSSGHYDITSLNYFVFNLLHEYCLSSYFPGLKDRICLNDCIANIYGLNGHVLRQNRETRIFLQPIQDKELKLQMDQAVSRFNAKNVKNRLGERISFQLSQ